MMSNLKRHYLKSNLIKYLAKFSLGMRSTSRDMIASPQTQEPNKAETFDGLKPLLVLGGGRTGTTLLMQLLGTSPQIAFDRVYPFEVQYLTYLLRWAQMLGQEWEQGGHWNRAESAGPPNQWLGPFPYENARLWNGQEMWPGCFAAAWREFSRVAVARTAAKGGTDRVPLYFAEKIPHWVPGLLRQAIPCNIILLVRDPRDVFLSITAFDKKRGFSGFARRADDDDWTFAHRFVKLCQQAFKIIRAEEADPYNILVKYERLVLDSANESRRLSEHLGVRLDIGVVEKQVSQFAHHMTSNTARESVERWRRELPTELNEFFLKGLRKELRYFGYET
jgi:Txe/YoeB family toxin of Txe-Axe toxin-antitoxin module